MRLILAAKSTRDADNYAATSERLVNVYPVPAPQGSKADFILRSVPGTRHFCATMLLGRAIAQVAGTLYVVAGGGLYRIAENGISSFLSAIDDDINTAMSGHRDDLLIAAGGSYNLWDGSSLTEPGSGRITDVGSVAFLDQFTLIGERDGREIEWTEVGQPEDRNALYFKTAEARDDNLVRVMDFGGYAYALKERTTEIWGATQRGGAGAFARVQGPVVEVGLLDFNLACWTPQGLFIVGHDGTVRLITGQMAQPVSEPQVDQALKSGTPTHCFYYEDRGAKFACIRFSDRPAWCWDMTMQRWHERSKGVNHEPWDIVGSAYCYDQWHLLSRLGRVYRLGTTPADAEGVLRRTVIGREVYNDGNRFSVSMLELMGQFGRYALEETAPNWVLNEWGLPMYDETGRFVLAATQGEIALTDRPGRLWIRVSKDGATFGLPKHKDVGKAGEFWSTCRFRALGNFRKMVVEVNMTDPVDFPLLSTANLEAA